MKALALAVRFFVAAAAATATAHAQLGTGTVSGIVTDPQDAVVPGVQIEIVHIGTNAANRTLTNDQGFYTVPGIPVGTYTVRAEIPGFKQAVRSGVRVEVDQRARVDFRLELGTTSEVVEVRGEAPLVDTGSASVGKVFDNRRVLDLPLNGRNALALVLLTPSVKSNAGPTNSGFGDRGIQLSSISINGGPNSMNGMVLDGGNNIQSYIGEVNISPAVDAVEEFKVQSATLSAEFGFTAGGVVNIVTKSGTNSIHGSAYHFLRNDALDARNAFAASKPPFRYNQYGVAIGGPAVKDRTFYFGNWEQYHFRQATSQIGSFPISEQRQGDFSNLRDVAGRLIPIFDPATTRANPSGSGFIRDAFPGNVIPSSRLDPVSLKLNEFYPFPNRPPTDLFTNSNNYQRLGSEARFMSQYTIKVDHRLSPKNSLFGRFAYFQHETDNGASAATIYPNDVVAKRDDNLQNRNFVLSDAHTFSPTLINEFRGGMTRSYFPFVVRSFGGGWPQKLGLPASVPPDTFPSVGNGLPGFNTGTAGVRGSLYWQLFDMITKIHGGHTFKLGVDYRILRGNNFQRSSPSGSFTFSSNLTANPQSPAGTGSAYATFLLGAVSSASVTTHLGEAQHAYSTSVFFQDDWKVARRLTLNLGLRYDFQQQPVERYNGASSFDPFSTDPVSGLPGRTVFAGVDGQPRSFREDDHNDLGPRFGFAWDVFGNARTVVRGGYSIFYPYQFWRQNFGNPAGFASTSTSYLPPGGNTNFPAFQFKDGLPSPPIAPQGSKLGPSAFLGQSVAWDESDGRTPMTQQWTLSVQHELRGGWLVDASYSGNVGHHFTANGYDFNQLDPKFLDLGLTLQDRVSNPNAGKVPGALGAATITRSQFLRPYPHYTGISVRFPRIGNYNSHLLLLSVEKRMAEGLALLFSYTAGKVISDSLRVPVDFGPVEQTNVWDYQNGKFDRRSARAVDPTDVAQRVVLSALYELPFGAGKRWAPSSRLVNGLAGGWQINAIGILQSGLPLFVRGANNFLADRPSSTGRSARLDHPTAARWFDTEQFVNPPNFTFGNAPRSLPDVRSPGTANWDLSVIKNTRISEGLQLQFRAESFNFLNRVNLGIPNTTFVPGPDGKNRSGTFGVITRARDARVVQLALKLVF